MNANDLFEENNRRRIAAGRSPQTFDERVEFVARQQAERMARIDDVTHDNPAGKPGTRLTDAGYEWRAVAENVAAEPTAVDAFNSWMNSAGHRATILGDYVNAGFGAATARSGVTYCAGVYASPMDAGGPSDPTPTPSPGTPAKRRWWHFIRRWLWG